VENNILVKRPWGTYEILSQGLKYKVKKIAVFPGAKLSLQSHEHRAEHWVVVRGIGTVIKGNKEFAVKENESIYVPISEKHRLSNPGKENLEIIEVQTGDYLEEDDIVRYEDIYNRVVKN
jgi:mannose-6-phosphate isomerase-like protein (cupin superfamily)